MERTLPPSLATASKRRDYLKGLSGRLTRASVISDPLVVRRTSWHAYGVILVCSSLALNSRSAKPYPANLLRSAGRSDPVARAPSDSSGNGLSRSKRLARPLSIRRAHPNRFELQACSARPTGEWPGTSKACRAPSVRELRESCSLRRPVTPGPSLGLRQNLSSCLPWEAMSSPAERKVSPTRRRWQSIWNRDVIAAPCMRLLADPQGSLPDNL